MRLKRRYLAFAILFLIYVNSWIFIQYSNRVLPCGDTCIPERPFAHPFLQQTSMIIVYVLVGPTLLVIFPLLKFMESTSVNDATAWAVFMSFIVWIIYFYICRTIYLFIKYLWNNKKKII